MTTRVHPHHGYGGVPFSQHRSQSLLHRVWVRTGERLRRQDPVREHDEAPPCARCPHRQMWQRVPPSSGLSLPVRPVKLKGGFFAYTSALSPDLEDPHLQVHVPAPRLPPRCPAGQRDGRASGRRLGYPDGVFSAGGGARTPSMTLVVPGAARPITNMQRSRFRVSVRTNAPGRWLHAIVVVFPPPDGPCSREVARKRGSRSTVTGSWRGTSTG